MVAPAPTIIKHQPWTEEENDILRRHYCGENRNRLTIQSLSVYMKRTPASLSGELVKLGLTEGTPRWSSEDLGYLNDTYGILPAKKIAEHLHRSTNALKIISYRRLRINQRSNIYTAREIAKIVGAG